MAKLFRSTFLLLIAFIGMSFANHLLTKKNNKVIEVEVDEVVIKRKVKRGPASTSKVTNLKKFVPNEMNVTTSSRSDVFSNRNPSIYDDPETKYPDSDVYSGVASEDQSFNSRAPSFVRNDFSFPEKKENKKPESSNISFTNASYPYNSGISLPPKAPTASGTGSGAGSPKLNPTIVPPVSDDLLCSTNVGGGAYANPLQVSISCSATSDIRYCIQAGSCCDPESSGTAYTSPIVIGAENGDYCLSFFGEATSSKVSSITQQTYAINHTYPDLQVSFPKIFYQTTQLAGKNFLLSNDFGKANYTIGEINLKSSDPGPSGLNMSCEEIYETYVALPSPAVEIIFNPMAMLGIPSGNQLNVPLVLSKLIYGENFLASYVVNTNFAVPLYSCSTNKVTLEDFSLFVPEVSHSEIGTNEATDFSGSFVAYSFFEADGDVDRTPAGLASDVDNGQELRVGSFGVFY